MEKSCFFNDINNKSAESGAENVNATAVDVPENNGRTVVDDNVVSQIKSLTDAVCGLLCALNAADCRGNDFSSLIGAKKHTSNAEIVRSLSAVCNKSIALLTMVKECGNYQMLGYPPHVV